MFIQKVGVDPEAKLIEWERFYNFDRPARRVVGKRPSPVAPGCGLCQRRAEQLGRNWRMEVCSYRDACPRRRGTGPR